VQGALFTLPLRRKKAHPRPVLRSSLTGLPDHCHLCRGADRRPRTCSLRSARCCSRAWALRAQRRPGSACTPRVAACHHAGRALRPPRTLSPLEPSPAATPARPFPALAVVCAGERRRRPRGPLAEPQPPLRRPAPRLPRAMCAMRQCAMPVPPGGCAACMRSMGHVEGWDPMPAGPGGSTRRLHPSWQCMGHGDEG